MSFIKVMASWRSHIFLFKLVLLAHENWAIVKIYYQFKENEHKKA